MCRLLARKMRSLRGYSSGPYRRSFCGDTARQGTPNSRGPPARPGPSLPPSLTCSIQALNSCSSAGENGAVSGSAAASPCSGSARGAGPGRARTEPSRPRPGRAKSPPALPVPLYLRPRAPRRRRGPAARPRSAARASPWPGRAEPGRTGRSGAHPDRAEPSAAERSRNGPSRCQGAGQWARGRGIRWAWHWDGAGPGARRVRRYPARKTITNPGSP